jgi:hypothetical protein
MARYVLAIMLVCVLCIAIAGCGGGTTKATNDTGGEPQPDVYTGPGGGSGGSGTGGGDTGGGGTGGGGTITPPAPPSGGTNDPITPPPPPIL